MGKFCQKSDIQCRPRGSMTVLLRD